MLSVSPNEFQTNAKQIPGEVRERNGESFQAWILAAHFNLIS